MRKLTFGLIITAILFAGVLLAVSKPGPTGFVTKIVCETPGGCWECSTDEDCGAGSFTGSYFCQASNVYGDYKKPVCVILNPEVSTCTEQTVPQLVDVCDETQYCVKGVSSCQYLGGCTDFDGSGYADLSDVVIMTSLAWQNTTRNSSFWREYADFDDNGIINMADYRCSLPNLTTGRAVHCPRDSFICETCEDGKWNGNETDVDCGGSSCGKCELRNVCLKDSDCITGDCTNGICVVPPTCNDTVLNGNETDIDCGGTACFECLIGNSCIEDSDCAEGACLDGVCRLREVLLPVLSVQPSIDVESEELYVTITGQSVNGVDKFTILTYSSDGEPPVVRDETCGGETYCKVIFVTSAPRGKDVLVSVTVTDSESVTLTTRINVQNNEPVVIPELPEGITPDDTSGVVTDLVCQSHADCGGDTLENYCEGGLRGDSWSRSVTRRCVFNEVSLQSSCVEDSSDSLVQACDSGSETCRDGVCIPDGPELEVGDVFWDPVEGLRQYGQASAYVRVINRGYSSASFDLEYAMSCEDDASLVDSGVIAARDIVETPKEEGVPPAESLVFVQGKVFEKACDYCVTTRVSSEKDTAWRPAKELKKCFNVRKPVKLCAERFANVLWCESWVYK